jgi:hypothetical protein
VDFERHILYGVSVKKIPLKKNEYYLASSKTRRIFEQIKVQPLKTVKDGIRH